MRGEVDEEALMEAYVAGDADAFERLFRTLAPSIHAFFVRTVGRGAVAEDLLQTTFLKLHAARANWRRGERLRNRDRRGGRERSLAQAAARDRVNGAWCYASA